MVEILYNATVLWLSDQYFSAGLFMVNCVEYFAENYFLLHLLHLSSVQVADCFDVHAAPQVSAHFLPVVSLCIQHVFPQQQHQFLCAVEGNRKVWQHLQQAQQEGEEEVVVWLILTRF